MTMIATYCELKDIGLIAFSGPDAMTFLQGQLTSDVAALTSSRTQYSGYCTPKGRLLATSLLWRIGNDILMQLPASLRESIQARITKYVLRAKVQVSDASARYVLFGVAGADAQQVVESAVDATPKALHDVTTGHSIAVTRLSVDRYLLVAPAESATRVRAILDEHAAAQSEGLWSALDVQAGIAVITPQTQEQYVPQMVNLDLIGAVSYSKGCYPGQEIVARTHYLGRTKQRTYRVRVPSGVVPKVSDRIFSDEYGADQASGAILNTAHIRDGDHEALAVLYTSSVARGVHYGALDGPIIELLPLPYSLNT